MSLYTKKIPNNYQVCMVIDVYEKGVAYLFKIIAYIILFIICGLMLYLKKPEFNFEDTKDLIIPILIYMAAMLVYLSLHEGLHGIIYKIFTKEKLSFRYGLTNAFCGVPQLYVKKWPTLIALITPFVILTAGFVPTIILMPNNVYSLLLIVLFAIHLSSCIGDLYIVGLLFTLSKDVLVNNDGMKYSFYLPKEQVL